MKWSWMILAILFLLLMTGLGFVRLPLTFQHSILTGLIFFSFCAGSFVTGKVLPGSAVGLLFTPTLGVLALRIFDSLNPELAKSLPEPYPVFIVGVGIGALCLFSFLQGSLQKEQKELRLKREEKNVNLNHLNGGGGPHRAPIDSNTLFPGQATAVE